MFAGNVRILSEYFPTVSCGFAVIAFAVVVVVEWGVRALHIVFYVVVVVSLLRGIPLKR